MDDESANRLEPAPLRDEFYTRAANYWSEIPATVDGMLGGFGHISRVDLNSSKQFLKSLFQSKKPPGKRRALDCGAGIGRVTKHLLVHTFETVDLVEQNPFFLDQAREYLGPNALLKIGNLYPAGLQSFVPEHKYDVIWCQWVLGHLTDSHLLDFLRTCGSGLRNDGVIVIKENITSSGEVETDEKDSSVTRPFSLLVELFGKADLECFRKIKQQNFPRGLYAVYTFALRPRSSAKVSGDVRPD